MNRRGPGGRTTVSAMASRTLAALAGAGLAVTLSACFTTAADFQEDAQDFIVGDEQLRRALFPDTDTSFTSATCDEPRSQDEGETFLCDATDSDGRQWEFEIEITGSSDYDVNVSRRPP